MRFAGPIWLASRSPRRRQLLEAAGFDVQVHAPDIEDSLLLRGRVTPQQWVMALAYLKARRVADHLLREQPARRGTVLAADTVCVADDRVIGQPTSLEHARTILRSFRNTAHLTITGLCLLTLGSENRWMLVDGATVRWGDLSDEEIEGYLDSGAWQGKAGAYNLRERLAAGWPISCEGDPTTVMGLPMQRLQARLSRL